MLVPRAPGHDGYSLPVRDFDCLSHFLGGAGDDHDFRVAGCLGAVVFEDYQVLGGVQDVPLPYHPDELFDYFLRDHFVCSLEVGVVP